MSDNEYDSYSEEEEITDLSNPNVVEKYKVAADIVNKALKGVLSPSKTGSEALRRETIWESSNCKIQCYA